MKKHTTFIFVCLIFTTTLFAQKIEEGFNAMFKPSTSGWRYYLITEKKKICGTVKLIIYRKKPWP